MTRVLRLRIHFVEVRCAINNTDGVSTLRCQLGDRLTEIESDGLVRRLLVRFRHSKPRLHGRVAAPVSAHARVDT